MAKTPQRRRSLVQYGRRQKKLRLDIKHWSTRRTGTRATLALKQKYGIRDVVKTDSEFMYEAFIQRRTSPEFVSLNDTLTNWCRVQLNSKYKIHKIEFVNIKRYVSSIKISDDTDLMVFMLMFGDKTRKVFRYVKESN